MADPVPFGVGGPAEPTADPSPLVGNLLAGILGIPKHLIDASANAVPGLRKEDVTDNPNAAEPNQPLYNASMQTAGSLAGLGAPAAEAGAAGIFGGKLAQTADIKALIEAQKMRMGGKYPDQVWNDTGWFRHPADNQWRFEIPDNSMGVKYMPTGEGDMASTLRAHHLVDHPELFKAYPDLTDIRTSITKDSRYFGGYGAYNPAGSAMGRPSIDIGAPNLGIADSVMAHELQHGVQDLEGFTQGADPSHYAGMIEQGLKKNPELLGGHDFMTIVNQAPKLYRGTAGEVEARNVENRLDWSAKARRAVPPWQSQDTTFNNQFVHDPVTGMVTALYGPNSRILK